jgi:23S rRNA (adenine2503-C2)-methyltransferase
MSEKFLLTGKSLSELEDFVVTLGESKFRAKQLHSWVYEKSISDFAQMTNISKDFKAKLQETAIISDVKIKQRQISKDGTIKYLIEYADGNLTECVLMRFDNRSNLTACVSSQVGCAVGCKFCATGKLGFVRNLSAEEIAEQVLSIQRDTGLKITNVVYMGQGEPLLNFDNVNRSIEILNKELQIGIRRITVSTSGIVPGITKLAETQKPLTLALSLHAPIGSLREEIMPITKKYPLNEVINSLKFWMKETDRRITIEYTLIKDVNDSIECAQKTVELLKDIHCNINIIPYNPVCSDQFQKPDRDTIYKFKYILEQAGKKTTVRLERGADIDAACGQLASKMK